MAITPRTSPANQSGNASSVAFSRDASVQVGDLRLVFIFTSSGVTMPSPPSGWSVILDTNIAPDTTRRLYVISRVYASGDAASTTITFSGATNYGLGQVALGGALGTVHAGPTRNTGDDGTGGTQTAPSLTSTVPDTVLVCFFGQAAGGSTSAVISLPSGMTNLGNSVGNGSQGSSTRLAYENRPATGATNTRTATSPSTGKWAGVSVLVAPASTPVSATDAGTGTDTVTVAKTTYAALADAGAGTDPVTVAADLGPLTDSGTGSDTVAVEVLEPKTVSDSGTGSDTVQVNLFVPASVAEQGTGADTVTVDRTTYVPATEQGVGSELVAVERQDRLTDSGTGTDTTGAVKLAAVADAGTGTEEVRVVDIPFTQVLPLRQGAVYELVVVARVPAASGSPTLIEVDPIEWKSLSYTNTLSQPQELEASCLISSVTEPVLQRLRRLHENATELWLYRDGRVVFAGPLQGWRTSGESLTLQARGLLAYLRLMMVTADLRFDQVDQFQIVKALVDQWQALDFGHYGIDTAAVGTSGVKRDGTYLRDELHNIGQRVEELGKRINGFDVEVDPASRKLQLWAPGKGVDRSSGEDAIVVDARNITSGDVLCSVAIGDLASEAFGTGTSSGADGTLWSAQSNTELRARYGRSAVSGTWSDVSEQATLDAHTQGLLDARGEALIVPGPNVRVTPDADIGDYAEGDTIAYDLQAQLGVSGSFRIRRQKVSVSSTGQESVDLEFV